VLALSLTSTAPELAVARCGEPVPQPGVLKGTFDVILFDDPCESQSDAGHSLATSYEDAAPLLTMQTTSHDHCVWAIVTAVRDRLAAVAADAGDLGGARPTQDSEGGYWATTGGEYLHVSPNGLSSHEPAFKRGYSPAAIDATSDGALYAIETRGSDPDNSQAVVVDVSNGSVNPTVLSGSFQDFFRGGDGSLYFELRRPSGCELFQVDRFGSPIARGDCGSPAAVGPDGGIWRSGFYRIEETGVARPRGPIGPVWPSPCVIDHVLLGWIGTVIADGRGNVWFEFNGRLWRYDAGGHLEAKPFPNGWNIDYPIVETSDGSIWVSASDQHQNGALIRFTATP
jgi:hypothetical protein